MRVLGEVVEGIVLEGPAEGPIGDEPGWCWVHRESWRAALFSKGMVLRKASSGQLFAVAIECPRALLLIRLHQSASGAIVFKHRPHDLLKDEDPGLPLEFHLVLGWHSFMVVPIRKTSMGGIPCVVQERALATRLQSLFDF